MFGEVLPENHSGTNRMTSVVRNRSWDLRGALRGVDPWGLGGSSEGLGEFLEGCQRGSSEALGMSSRVMILVPYHHFETSMNGTCAEFHKEFEFRSPWA